MTNSNISSKIQLEIIQQHFGNFFREIHCYFQMTLNFPILFLTDNLQVLSNPDKTISDHVDNLLLTNSLEENIFKRK